ncbi:MAG: STAS domain-containing protein, partial [Salinibacterium sp.]|nr:STAS domain-containing protein [Salinibacterium sp.]
VVIELTNVGIIDSFTTRIINQIGMTARLMGARTIVAGLQPAVAITMVEMGIEMEGIETVLTVDDALEMLGFRIDDGADHE